MSRNFSFVMACACFVAICVTIYCSSEKIGASVNCTGFSTSCATYANLWDGSCCESGGFSAFVSSGEGTKTRIPETGSCGKLTTWWGALPCCTETGGCGGTRASSDCL